MQQRPREKQAEPIGGSAGQLRNGQGERQRQPRLAVAKPRCQGVYPELYHHKGQTGGGRHAADQGVQQGGKSSDRSAERGPEHHSGQDDRDVHGQENFPRPGRQKMKQQGEQDP